MTTDQFQKAEPLIREIEAAQSELQTLEMKEYELAKGSMFVLQYNTDLPTTSIDSGSLLLDKKSVLSLVSRRKKELEKKIINYTNKLEAI